MNQKKIRSTLVISILLVSVAFAAISVQASTYFRVSGTLYIDDGSGFAPADAGIEVILSFVSGNYTGFTDEDGYYIIDDYMPESTTGCLFVNLSGTIYSAEDAQGNQVCIQVVAEPPYIDNLDLYVNVSQAPPPNDPPNVPNTPDPYDGETGVDINHDLSWVGGDPDIPDTVTYDIYFGNTTTPPKIVTNNTGPLYDPGQLTSNTTYYWKIVAWDDHGASTEGPVWNFTTVTNSPPYVPSVTSPTNGATGVAIDASLIWTGGDPDGDPVTYDVYFGTASNPPIKVNNQSGTTYAPALSYSTTYHWKIIAWDDEGASAEGPIWSFTTQDPPSGNGYTGNGGTTPSRPTADANGPYYAALIKGVAEVTFDGSGSTGSITSYSWDFGDGSNGTGVSPTHQYTALEVYIVNLTVTGPGGSDWDVTQVTISEEPNIPPTDPDVAGPHSGTKNTDYEYTAVSTDGDNDTIQYIFEWGDDTNTTTEFLANGTATAQTHSWAAAGVYTIRVKAFDNKTVSGTTQYVVLIDVHWVKHIGYLIDTDSDDTYELFHSNETGDETDVELLVNGSYLINSDEDSEWDWFYDLETDTLTPYTPGEEAEDNMIWYALIIGLIIVIIFLFLIAAAMKKKEKPKGKPKKPKK